MFTQHLKALSLRAPEPYSFFFPRINAILPALQIGLELTRGNRLSEDDLQGSNVCSTLHPPDIAVDSLMFTGPEVGGYRANAPSCAAK